MLEIGRIARAHGVDGEVGVKLITNRTERLAPGSVLSTQFGELTVVSARPQNDSWLVQFAEIPNRLRAEEMRGVVLSAEPIHDPDELWVHHLVGSAVVDQDNVQQGRVTKVIDNPASDLLELDSGALVPVRFVVSNVPGVSIEVNVPSGLFDLNTSVARGSVDVKVDRQDIDAARSFSGETSAESTTARGDDDQEFDKQRLSGHDP